MRTRIIVPARLASTRLPRKPLAAIAGRAMVLRVLDVARAADVGPVTVAAADLEIVDAVTAAGFSAVLTDPALPSGSDRVRAAADLVDPQGEAEVIVNLQGDMPTLDPQALRAVVAVLEEGAVDIATLATATTDPREKDDPNVVKAILALNADGRRGRALYFTRAAAPTGPGPVWHHIGVYAFRRRALEAFTAMTPSPLEQRERLEQLRALEAGMRIDAAVIDAAPEGVDTPEDLARARAWFEARTASGGATGP